jgi:CRISPR-associated protein Csd1
MTLNTESHDRSYNYGRLLAVLDSAESYALYQKHNNRSTNAQRYISNYMQRPATTFKNIYTAVIKNLDPKNLQYLQRDLDAVMDNLTELDIVDGPLTSKALLGFSHERTAIKKRRIEHAQSQTQTQLEED